MNVRSSPASGLDRSHIAVIGAGPMGMAVAYELALQGCHVTLFEADDRLGGMAASFEFSGVQLERYYHFHCLSDGAFFALLEELGLGDAMQWKHTTMGFFHEGRHHPWGTAGAVLRFRRLPLSTRLRYLALAARCLTLHNWQHLDGIPAHQWLKQWLGLRGYAVLWEKLFRYKFYHHSETISAAWIWSRIRRLGQSRRRLRETLGYLEGGSQRWIKALGERLVQLGVNIRLSTPVMAIERGDTHAAQATIRTAAGSEVFDALISTVPLPLVAPMLRNGGHRAELVAPYEAQLSVACACVVVQTRQPITANFWTNVNDSRFGIPGIIEMSNLQPLRPHITYIPFYMPADHPDYGRPNQAFIDDAIECLKAINSQLQDDDILATHCSRYRYAQPVCGTHFRSSLPPLRPIERVWIADTTVYYPEDRGIAESVSFGRNLARDVASTVQNG